MSFDEFENFKRSVLADESLQRRIRNIEDRTAFVEAVVALAAEIGCEVTAHDVEEALRRGNQAWIERWV